MLRLKAIKCGKDCKKCPHGWYVYAHWKEGGKTKDKYLGKYGEPETQAKVYEIAKKHPTLKVIEEYNNIKIPVNHEEK